MSKKEYLKKWKAENADKVKAYRASHREEHKTHQKTYRLRHPKKIKEMKARSPFKSQKATWFARIAARDGKTCRNCGTSEQLTLQHKVPRCIGGEYSYENLEILCLPCNIKDFQVLTKAALRLYFRQTH